MRRPQPTLKWLGLGLLAAGVALLVFAGVRTGLGPDHPAAAAARRGPVACIGAPAPSGAGKPADSVKPPPAVGRSARFGAGRTPVCGFTELVAQVVRAGVSKLQLCLLAALTDAQRERGLMEIADPDLGGYDGMIFVFPADQAGGGFYMRDTPQPLSIAYLDSAGRLVSTAEMAPCGDAATCPIYPAAAPFRMALEVPQGGLSKLGITPGSVVTVSNAPNCPART